MSEEERAETMSFENVVCHVCGEEVCSDCGCCGNMACVNCSCPDAGVQNGTENDDASGESDFDGDGA